MSRPVWRRHPWLTLIFVVASVLAAGLALRVAVLVADAPDTTPVIEGWMTPRYIVHSYGLVPEQLAQVLAKEPGESPNDTLLEIAATRGVPVSDLTAAVQALLSLPVAPP